MIPSATRRRQNRPKATAPLIGAVLIAVCVLSACSSSGSKPSSTTTKSGSPSTGSSGSGELTNVSTALAYTNGTAGAAKSGQSPIKIGFITQQGGPQSYPEELVAVNAAVKYVNTNLGGVGGHPLQVDNCTVSSTEQQGLACAQKFLNDKSIPLVATGTFTVGNQSVDNTLGGQVPLILGNLNQPADFAAKNTIGTDSGILSVLSIASFVKQAFHPKTVSLVYPNNPQFASAVKQIEPALGSSSGITLKTASFPEGSTNLTAPVIAAGGKDTDVFVALVETAACPSMSKTLDSVGRTKPVVTLTLCLDPTVKSALGDYPKWNYLSPVENQLYPAGSPAVKAYLAALAKYAGPDAKAGGQANLAFSSVLTATRILNTVGADKVSRATVTTALSGYSGPGFMEPPVTCTGKLLPGSPAVCTLGTFAYKYNGNGSWASATGGKVIYPTP